MCILVYFKA